MIINCYQPYWNSGLVVWFSPCVQEEPVSILGCPHVRPDYSVNYWQQFHIRRNTAILVKFFEKNSAKQIIKNLKIRALWLSIVDNHLYGTVKGLVAGSSRWVREVAGAIPGWPNSRLFKQLVPTIPCPQEYWVFREINWNKNVCKTDYKNL